ncbi:MAG: hypothetical protein AAGA03_08695 [Planctomycetota bacterium]
MKRGWLVRGQVVTGHWARLGLVSWLLIAGQSSANAQPIIDAPDDSLIAPQPAISGQPVASVAWRTPASSVNLPAAGAIPAGFTAQVEIDSTFDATAVPVTIRLVATSTFNADRTIVAQFRQSFPDISPAINALTVNVPIQIQQGTSRVEVKRLLPKFTVGDRYNVRLLEDQTELPEYEGEIGSADYPPGMTNRSRMPSGYPAHSAIPRVLMVPDKGDGSRQATYPEFVEPWSSYLADIGSGSTKVTPIDVRDASSLTEDWRRLRGYSVIVTSSESLQTMQTDQLVVVRRFVMLGGCLVITEAGDVETEMDRLSLGSTTLLSSSRYSRRYAAANYALGLRRSQRGFAMQSTIRLLRSLPQSNDVKPFWDDRFLWCRCAAAGLVIGLPDENGNGTTSVFQHLAARSMAGDQVSPLLIRGADPIVGDRRFNEWLIAGVARPPVYTFIGLLGVFVVLVGPVAYYKTTRTERGYLMFLIAPVLALVTTLSFFAYGLISDGFGVQARVRQISWIDGASGDAAVRTRATYFAGIRPGNGLTFPSDVEVIPYRVPNAKEGWETIQLRDGRSEGTITVTDESQNWSSAFLPSREQRQFVTHRFKSQLGRIRLTSDASSNERRVSSEFDFPIRDVCISDRDGQYWVCESVDANQNDVKLQSVQRKDASERLLDLYSDHQPLALFSESPSNARRYMTHDVLSSTSQLVFSELTEGPFEAWLKFHLQLSTDLPAGHFLATTDIDPSDLATDVDHLSESVHYLIGSLP